jgi:4'-phosphopantetheinyl transferase
VSRIEPPSPPPLYVPHEGDFPDLPILEKSAVHVWRLKLPLGINDKPARLERLRAGLSPDEQARAARYHFDVDRRRFAWTRGVLRTLLAYYVDTTPDRIQFGAGAKGKLHLTPPHGGLRFNVSHSGEWACLALTRDREVGVDVEQHRPLRHDLFGIADRFFAPAEVAALRAVPASDQEPAFFRIWSRKEAYIKATGEGVSAGLDTFEVSSGEEAAVTLRVYGHPEEDQRWMMRSLDAAPGYAAAICIEGQDADITVRDW